MSRRSWACFNAYHARRIVLGASGGAVVVLELDWRRVDLGPDRGARGMGIKWKGPVRVGLLDAAGAELRDARPLPAVNFQVTRNFDETDAIKKAIRAALVMARTYPGFRAADLPEHRSCDFAHSCDSVRVEADAGRVVLSVTQPTTAMKVPVPIPKGGFFAVADDAPAPASEVAPELLLVSLLRYDVNGRAVLVVDLGAGDEERGDSEEAMWPPCGCETVARCPPVAATMHHGSQVTVVIPLDTPAAAHTTLSPAARPVSAPDAGELSRAEHQPAAALRTDGIYAADPVCDGHSGWTRRFLRFFPDGTVRQVDGNLTPTQAFRLAAKDSPWMIPGGNVTIVGRHVSATILEDEAYVQRRQWKLDGIFEDDGPRATSAAAGGPAESALFRLTAPD